MKISMSILRNFIRNYPFSMICIALVWILSLAPFFPETPLDDVEFIDKWVHIVMYGGTCMIIWLEYFLKHKQYDYKKLLLWAWLAPVIMGGVLELLQAYCTFGHRNGDWLDFAANTTGCTLIGIIGFAVTAIRKK